MQESETIRYSAPGKLFFLGEYAVLAGGWTLVAAMNRRVQANRLPIASGYRAIGAGSETTLDLPRAVLESIDDVGGDSIDHFETDVRSFFEGSQKLGLGSSAASVVALSAAALHSTQKCTAADNVFQKAFTAHRLLQNGRGSGADVAASAYGGLLAYRLNAATLPFTALQKRAELDGERTLLDARIVSGLVWPDELEFRAIWIGDSASSTVLIGRVEQTLRQRPDAVSDVLSEISNTAEAGLHALINDNASTFIKVISKADSLMESLGDLTGAPIITKQHRALRSLAEEYGVVAKPSGAGGGDFSLFVGMRGAPWGLIERALPAGCTMIDLQFEQSGVHRDHAALARPS